MPILSTAALTTSTTNKTSPKTPKHSDNGRTPLSPSPPTSTTVASKDVRSYEHDRQRAMKAADYTKMRARKTHNGWMSKLYDSRKPSPDKAPSSDKLCSADITLRTDKALDVVAVGILPTSLSGGDNKADSDSDSMSEEDGRDQDPTTAVGGRNQEVKLADLITTEKRRKRNDGDFEFIPHVRSVIVLDDVSVPADMVLDEAWEHVTYHDDSEEDSVKAAAALSYAKVVSLTK